MTTPLIGILVSAISITLLSFLFHTERIRGKRFMSSVRERLDRSVTTVEKSLSLASRYIGREMPRQSMHYFLHTVLVSILHFLRRCEHGVYVARSNRLMARKVKRERSSSNKLDEVAKHKASVAMTEKEKQEHKEKMLEG